MEADVVDLLPDAVLAVDADRRIVQANVEAGRLLGHEPQAMLGKVLEDLLDPRTRDGRPVLGDGWHRSVRLRSSHGLPEQDLVVRHASGDDRRVYVTGRYLRADDGHLTGAVLVLRDASHRIRLRAEGIEIVSTVSHELRSPLTSVKGYTSMLLNRWDRFEDEHKKTMLGQINQDADRVTRMITELLDVSRLETGRLVLRRELVDLHELAVRVVERVGIAYEDLECAVEFGDDVPRVLADPDKIEQVLTNLVENAAKYGSPKGMRIVGSALDGAVEVAVIDQGPGIPATDLRRVFNKFFRREAGRPTGTGLGLWISRGLVEAHGGTLTVASEPGDGCTFSFRLPVVSLEDLLGDLDDGEPSTP